MEAIKDKAQELFDQFAAKLDKLLAEKDYLESSDPDFREGLEVLKEDFEKALKEIEPKFSDLLDAVDAHDDLKADAVLDRLADSDIVSYLEDNSYVLTKVEGMADRAKLEEFITQNIYPYDINLL